MGDHKLALKTNVKYCSIMYLLNPGIPGIIPGYTRHKWDNAFIGPRYTCQMSVNELLQEIVETVKAVYSQSLINRSLRMYQEIHPNVGQLALVVLNSILP